jgi:hypothetical protein
MNASKSGDSGFSLSKRESQWRWFKVLHFLIGNMNARNMESNLRFDFVKVDQVTDSVQDNYTGTENDFIAECFSAENSIHTATPSEFSWSSIQRRTRPQTGKCPVEEAMIKIERKRLDLMQSVGKEHKD